MKPRVTYAKDHDNGAVTYVRIPTADKVTLWDIAGQKQWTLNHVIRDAISQYIIHTRSGAPQAAPGSPMGKVKYPTGKE